MTLGTFLVILLILILLGVIPRGGAYSEGWGYGPGGLVGLVIIIILILVLTGRL